MFPVCIHIHGQSKVTQNLFENKKPKEITKTTFGRAELFANELNLYLLYIFNQ